MHVLDELGWSWNILIYLDTSWYYDVQFPVFSQYWSDMIWLWILVEGLFSQADLRQERQVVFSSQNSFRKQNVHRTCCNVNGHPFASREVRWKCSRNGTCCDAKTLVISRLNHNARNLAQHSATMSNHVQPSFTNFAMQSARVCSMPWLVRYLTADSCGSWSEVFTPAKTVVSFMRFWGQGTVNLHQKHKHCETCFAFFLADHESQTAYPFALY